MSTIQVNGKLVHVFQLLTPEWYLIKDGSPLPSEVSEPDSVGDGFTVMKALDTILAIYGFIPKDLGWQWQDTRTPGYTGPGAGLFTIGWHKDDSWEAALSYNSRRIILPWNKAKGLPELSELEKGTLRRESRSGDTILLHAFMDKHHMSLDGASKFLKHGRYMVREEARCSSQK